MYAVETITSDRVGAAIASETSRFVFDYWNRLRADRPMPDRREIEPSDMARALGHLLLVQTEPDSFEMRLAGGQVVTAIGRELRGASVIDLWRRIDQHRIQAILATLRDTKSGAVLGGTLVAENDRTVPIEIMLLPLTLGGDTVARLLGTATPLEHPYWLGTERCVGLALGNVVLFNTARLEPTLRKRHPIFGHSIPKRFHRHLTLYDGAAAQPRKADTAQR